jgi:hypothetical protein
VRPDGTLKPHGDVIRRFAESRPKVEKAAKTVILDVTPDEYYADPWYHAQRLYQVYLGSY